MAAFSMRVYAMLVIHSVMQRAVLQDQDDSSLFQCQSSSDQSGLVYTPNIPDFYFDDENAADFRTVNDSDCTLSDSKNGRTYIFTIPSELHNCSGTVKSIQYCYRARNSDIGDLDNIFDFLTLALQEDGPQDGFTFTVLNRARIQTMPQDTICTDTQIDNPEQICCANTTSNVKILIPTTANYNYGIYIVDSNPRPLLFKNSASAFRVEHYQIDNTMPDVGSQIEVKAEDKTTVRGLLLVRFFIEVTTTATTAYNTGIVVGGAVGGVLAICIVILIASCMAVVVMKKHQSKQHHGIKEDEVMDIKNTIIYDEVDSTVDCNHDSSTAADIDNEYAGVGPRVAAPHEDVGRDTKESQEPHDEYYAGSGGTYEIEEETYHVPAKDEDELYAQLKDINIQCLPRNSVGIQDLLGSGQFGMVHSGKLQSGEGEADVAVKTLKEGSKEEDRVKFLQEAAIMGQFKHYNVVTMYGVVTEGEPILLVLELLIKGDLRGHLKSMKSDGITIDGHTLLSYCRQVASGMAYLSSKAFVHRDLAARNILVSDDEICKIADFGMSRDLMDESYYVSHGGKIPVKWTAPEALHYKKYSTASDVWSYGALMYEIWSVGHKPYEDFRNDQVIKLIDSGFRLPPPPGCPRALYTIMMSCWHSQAQARPVFPKIARELSLPDTKLLKWSEEDKSVHPEAAKLGADLLCAQDLYKDLQNSYKIE